MKLRVAEFEHVVSFVFAWWRHVMTSCHDVKNRLYSISACRRAREMILFCFYSFPACPVRKCYRFCVCMMSWRHDVTSWCHKTHFSYISFVDVLKWWYTCISLIILTGGFQADILYVFAWCFHVITWRHDVVKITTWRQETNCLHPSLQMCSRADSNSFRWFSWWLNSTWLLSSYLHDSMTSRNDVMTSLNMLYLSQLVDVLARWFFFCFYSFLGWQVQKYHKFCICICGYVIKWRYDVMPWLYDVT